MYFIPSAATVFVSACNVPQKIASRGKQAAVTKCVLESVRIRLVENGLSAYIFASLPSQRPAGEKIAIRAVYTAGSYTSAPNSRATRRTGEREDRFATHLSVSQHFRGQGQHR